MRVEITRSARRRREVLSAVTLVRATQTVDERPRWRAVAVPSEHGGWGLTLEPVLLGLLVAPTMSGLALGVAAFLAFLVRTPLKLAAVDLRRGRWLERSRMAVRLAFGELASMAILVVGAVVGAGWSWLVPVAIAAPLVGVELWFDVRSRSRRLVPEMCGAIGIAAVAAAIALAGDRSATLAAGLWLILAARSVGAIPFVRVQIARLRRGVADVRFSDVAQLAAVCVGAIAAIVDARLLGGLAALVVLAVVQLSWVRRPPVEAKVLGIRQMALGLGLVLITAVGVWVA